MTDPSPDTLDDKDEEFIVRKVAQNVFLVQEKYYESWNVANIWVVQGTRLDLVIDTGIGLWDLPAFLKRKQLIACNDKPYQAVATHIHFDHSGGLHQFDGQFAIHSQEADAIRTGDSYEAVCFMMRRECTKPPNSQWKARDYKLRSANPARILVDGDEFDLGDRTIRVLHLPGHSRGSIALFDEENGYFFSGDIIYNGPVLDWLPYGNVKDNIESYERIQELSPRVHRVFPAHGDDFDGTKLNEIATVYLEKVGMCHDCTAVVGKALMTVLLKGRNTKQPGPRCFYYSCCCCVCIPTAS